MGQKLGEHAVIFISQSFENNSFLCFSCQLRLTENMYIRIPRALSLVLNTTVLLRWESISNLRYYT